MRRTKQEAEATRDRILTVAEQLFLERGVPDVSLEQIAVAAGFTRGAVHWHFQNKTGLLQALIDRKGLPLANLASQLEIDESLDPIEALTNEITHSFGCLQTDPQRRRLAAYFVQFSATEAPERHHLFDQRLRATLTRIFELAEKRGRLAPCWRPKIAAIAMCGMTHGLVHQWLNGDPAFELGDEAIAALRAFTTSLSGRAGGKK